MERLFSYGTLKLPEVQTATFGRLLQGQADSLVGFRQEMLAIRDPDVVKLSGKTIIPSCWPPATRPTRSRAPSSSSRPKNWPRPTNTR